ncbi:hypothetical protein [Zavarzinella formosa]|uniref:hypothetical protein n=1 Tax=Zavarzinella formosa TaxID=360055 RepID=UPI00037A60A4|nr:hypothetical protein [Zavarzinella formosa]
MKKSLNILDDIRISSPCPVEWAGMAGDNRVRHCSQCDQAVYDLSALTTAEATELISLPQQVCVRLYRRSDGTVITRDCPAGRMRRTRQAVRRVALVLASWFGLAWVAGCTQGKIQCPAKQPPPEESKAAPK